MAVGGWALNHSLLPPMGGGTFKLIILPVGVVWIVVLGSVSVTQWLKSREEARKAGLKRTDDRLNDLIERHKR